MEKRRLWGICGRLQFVICEMCEQECLLSVEVSGLSLSKVCQSVLQIQHEYSVCEGFESGSLLHVFLELEISMNKVFGLSLSKVCRSVLPIPDAGSENTSKSAIKYVRGVFF